MPAIQPARLKQQSLDLVAKFSQPVQFVRELHSLLNRYTDYTRRNGLSGEPFPIFPAYNTPVPVMRQVWQDLSPLIRERPDEVLSLCDALWAEPNYELKILATRLLGRLPVDQPNPVIKRLQLWIGQELDRRLLDGLFENGFQQLQEGAPDLLLALVGTWLGSAEEPIQQAGIRALLPIMSQSGIERLPTIFRLLTPYLRIAPFKVRPDILAVLSVMIQYSPSETAHLLRQNLAAPNNPDTAWLIRQVIIEFPGEQKASLRQALKETR
jgi:hypothetical protein